MMTYNAFVFFTVHGHFFATWYYILLSEIQDDIFYNTEIKNQNQYNDFTIIQLVEVYRIEIIDPEIIQAIEQGTVVK